MPIPKGAQFSQILPPDPPVVVLLVPWRYHLLVDVAPFALMVWELWVVQVGLT